jgi:hypothetical protein
MLRFLTTWVTSQGMAELGSKHGSMQNIELCSSLEDDFKELLIGWGERNDVNAKNEGIITNHLFSERLNITFERVEREYIIERMQKLSAIPRWHVIRKLPWAKMQHWKGPGLTVVIMLQSIIR